MQSFLDPFEPKEESAEVKVFNLNHISGVQVEFFNDLKHPKTPSGLLRRSAESSWKG